MSARPSKAGPDPANEAQDDLSKLSYEKAISQLESIIARIESGEVSLEESLSQYKRGAALVRRCREVLDSAKVEVERIAASDLAARAAAGGDS